MVDAGFDDRGGGGGGGFSPPPDAGFYGNPYSNTGSIVEMTDTEDLLFRLQVNLSGKVVERGGEVRDVGNPLMNSEGIKDIMMVMRGFSDRASVMSNYDKNDIRVLMEMLSDVLSKNLLVNRVNYGFVNSSGRDLVFSTCIFYGYAIIKRGFEGGERRFWKGSQIDYRINSPDKKGGFLGGIFKK